MWNGVDPQGGGGGQNPGQSQSENVTVVEEANNNRGTGDQDQETGSSFKVGEPSPNYRLGESFYTSHNYFRREANNQNEAECLVCAEKQKNLAKKKRVMISTPNNSPKGMQNHLFAIHKELKEKILQQKAEHEKKRLERIRVGKESKKDESMKQQRLVPGGSGDQRSLMIEPRHDPQMQKRFDQAVVHFAAKTGVSFGALSNGNIDILIKAFFPKSNPKVHGRHTSTISRHTSLEADKIRRQVFSIVLSSKKDCHSYSFTSDMWKDLAMDSFISLTQHFITNDGDYIKLVPFCEYFGKRKHTGENIKISIEEMMKALSLDDENIEKNIVLDNASNNKCCIRLSSCLIGHWCANHTLNLAVKDTFKATVQNVPINNVNKKCKEMAKFVRGSEGRNNELKEACRQKQIKYRLPSKQMPVRWNTQEANISSVVRLRHALQFLVYNTANGWEDEKHSLSLQEFKMGESMVKVLEPAKFATKEWEADLTPSIHLVVREVFNMQGALTDFKNSTDKYIAGFAVELSKNIETRFPNCATDTLIYSVAHVLDPLFKGAILHEFEGAFERAKEEIVRLGLKHDQTEQPTVPVVRTESEGGSTAAEEKLTPAQRLLNRHQSRQRHSSAEIVAATPIQPANVKRELDTYLLTEEPGDMQKQEILSWWVQNKKKFPLLFQVVRMVLAIPASSSTSERVFSVGTKICSSLRRNLAPKKISDIMMINLNKENIEKYKTNVGITTEYNGPLDLFTWKDELGYLGDIEEDEDDLAEYEYEDEVNSDMENASENEEEED